MGFLSRRKKQGPEGFKGFVITLETAPRTKQKEILTAAILDDAVYAHWAHKNVLFFEDVLKLEEEELNILFDQIPNAKVAMLRAFWLHENEQEFLQKLDPRKVREYKDEKEYFKEPNEDEIRTSQLNTIKKMRELQETGQINSIKWFMPELDVMREKKADLSSGKWAYKHENGEIAAQGELVNYERHGKWIHFYPNGEIMAAGTYQRDMKEGPWVFFQVDGQKMAQGNYHKDEKVGEWSMYKDGEEIGTEHY